MEAAVIRASGEQAAQLEPRHLFPDEAGAASPAPEQPSFQEATRGFQAEFLAQTLKDNEWNIQATARRLDMSRSHLYNLIQALGLGRPKS